MGAWVVAIGAVVSRNRVRCVGRFFLHSVIFGQKISFASCLVATLCFDKLMHE